MRQSIWGWNSTGRKFWFITILILGHLFWIIFGHNNSSIQWRLLLSKSNIVTKALSSKWNNWRYARYQRISDINQANHEIVKLQTQLNDLLTAQASQATKLAEADEAIKLLGLKKTLPINFRSTRVVANTHRASHGCITIDQGHDNNLLPNLGIISTDGVVGRILDVGETQSLVLLLDAYNSSTGVLLERSRAAGVLQGAGNGKAIIRYINNQETVQVGEPVLTSGLDGVFPRGLLVGYVSGVKKQDIELKIEVSIAAKLDHLWLLLILMSNPTKEINHTYQTS